MKLRIFPMSLFVFALAACSGGGAPADTPAADGMTSATAAAPTPDQPPGSDSAPTPNGDCDMLSGDEITAAFGGKLTVSRSSGRGERGSGCTYSIAEVAEGQLILQAGDEAAYLAKKQAYSNQSRVRLEPMALGKEAHLVNGAQAIALRDDGKSISLGLSLMAFDAPAPVTEEETRNGISLLAEKAMARL